MGKRIPLKGDSESYARSMTGEALEVKAAADGTIEGLMTEAFAVAPHHAHTH